MENPKTNFSEWYTEITTKAKLCDMRYNVKGFVVFMPNSVITMKRMYDMYEAEMERTSHKPAWFPALIPESNFTKEGEHVKGFVPEVFWVTEAGGNKLEERLAMRPTSETAIYQMYSLWVQGKADLPLKIYHPSQVWRYETKATRPFIRSREFYWIESHDAFASEKEARAQVKEDMKMAERVIHGQFGIPFIFFQRPEWDKFPGAVHTFAADTLLPDGKVLQLPSTHLLGQNFAKAFNVTFLNEKGEREFCHQTTYGPAISRIYAALVSIHGDDKGLVFPFDLASTQIAIVPIIRKEGGEAVLAYCRKLHKKLSGKYRASPDASENTPGFKFNEWEMLGAPIRLEIGGREVEKQEVTIARRDTGAKETIALAQLKKKISQIRREILPALRSRADNFFNSRVFEANDLESLGEKLKSGGFVCIPFCTSEKEGEACAEKIKEQFSANVRGTRFGKKEKAEGNCIVCGKKAKALVYVARQY